MSICVLANTRQTGPGYGHLKKNNSTMVKKLVALLYISTIDSICLKHRKNYMVFNMKYEKSTEILGRKKNINISQKPLQISLSENTLKNLRKKARWKFNGFLYQTLARTAF